jgi:AGZA family xanthine/uracil permease-like MFS transporter
MPLLERLFHLSERRTTVRQELRGAVATFLTMAYILFVNPNILKDAGVPFHSAVACTAAAAGLCCLLMGLTANVPIALASGMGLNAVVAYQATAATGSWQTAMGLVVLNGLLVLFLVVIGVRERVMDAIPIDLRRAIGAGIGLFIAFIGLVNAGLVIRTTAPGAPPVTYGTLAQPAPAIALAGLLLTAALLVRRVPGALVLGILFGTGLGLLTGIAKLPSSLAPPSFESAFQANVPGALAWKFVPLLLSLMMVDFFDTLGTASAIAEQAGILDEQGRIPRLRSLLVVDSLSASIGGLFGASSVTAYIESASGVAEGARTGLHSVFVGLFFLGAIFLAPIAGTVPAAATAPALILVGFLMTTQVAKIDWSDYATAVPVFITLVTLPLTYSISRGIGYGFIAYAVVHLLTGRARKVHWVMWLTSVAFLTYSIWGS